MSAGDIFSRRQITRWLRVASDDDAFLTPHSLTFCVVMYVVLATPPSYLRRTISFPNRRGHGGRIGTRAWGKPAGVTT